MSFLFTVWQRQGDARLQARLEAARKVSVNVNLSHVHLGNYWGTGSQAYVSAAHSMRHCNMGDMSVLANAFMHTAAVLLSVPSG